MAQFYGSVRGQRGAATRLGGKASGLDVTAASYEGAVKVRLFHNGELGENWALVELAPWQGSGSSRVLYHGPVRGPDVKGGA